MTSGVVVVVVANLPAEGDAPAICGKTCAFAGRSCFKFKNLQNINNIKTNTNYSTTSYWRGSFSSPAWLRLNLARPASFRL
jgi:hypothetical protein